MIKQIELSKLNVNVANFRIGEFDTQREAIKAMLNHQNKKIVKLAADIIELGKLHPAKQLIVIHDQDSAGQYVVFDGNRRVTALKVLDFPELAKGTSVERDFEILSKKFLQAPIRVLPCVVFNDVDEAMLWVERDHSNAQNGRGQEKWDAIAESRCEAAKGSVRKSKAVFDYLSAKNKMPDFLVTALKRKTTTIDRVFNMPYFREKLGVIIAKDGQISYQNGNIEAGDNLLIAILNKFASRKFNVNNVRHLIDRIPFIDSFVPLAVVCAASGPQLNPISDHELSKQTEDKHVQLHDMELQRNDESYDANVSGATSQKKSMQSVHPAISVEHSLVRPSLARKVLANTKRDRTLSISDERLNRLYVEARRIEVDDFPNCSSFLMRVFLELATEHFLQRKKVPLPNGKTSWSEIGITLNYKIGSVLKSLDPSGKSHKLAAARKGISDRNFIHSTDTLHAYVHNVDMTPNPMELKQTWERWQPYFELLFNSFSK